MSAVFLRVDASAYEQTIRDLLAEMDRLAKLEFAPESLDLLLETIERAVHSGELAPLARRDDDAAAARAGDSRLVLEASERLLQLLAALRAWDGQGELVGQHQGASVPAAGGPGQVSGGSA